MENLFSANRTVPETGGCLPACLLAYAGCCTAWPTCCSPASSMSLAPACLCNVNVQTTQACQN